MTLVDQHLPVQYYADEDEDEDEDSYTGEPTYDLMQVNLYALVQASTALAYMASVWLVK